MGIIQRTRKYPDYYIRLNFDAMRKLLGEHEEEKYNILYTGSSSCPAKVNVRKGSFDAVVFSISVRGREVAELSIHYMSTASKVAGNIIDICNKIRSDTQKRIYKGVNKNGG